MNSNENMLELFIHKAQGVSAIVTRVADAGQALVYAVTLCEQKEACQLLAGDGGASLSRPAKDPSAAKQVKTMAAPGLPEDQKTALADLCQSKGIQLLEGGLREHLSGIDIGLTYADFGIAETGTLVVDSSSEEIRLATMISEVHVGILPQSCLRQTGYEVEEELVGMMRHSPNYTAFITGASRTADIERVLALGVHGPLEFHILIREDA